MQNENQRSAIDDIDLAATIATLLHRRTAFASVLVAVSEGIVTLEGHVSCTDDRKAAESVARRLARVRGIENCLTVQASSSEDAESAADPPVSE
jgi:osmotically-inducible protein OsmY